MLSSNPVVKNKRKHNNLTQKIVSIFSAPPPPKNRYNTSYLIAFLACIYLFLFFLNAIFPTQSDDIGIDSIDIQRAIDFYMNLNGRFGVFLGLWFGSYMATTLLFPFINAFVGLSFIVAFFVVVFGRMPKACLFDLTFLCLILLLMMSDATFGSIFFWAAGSFSYLWMYLLLCLYLIPYRLFWGRVFASKSIKLDSKNTQKDSTHSNDSLFVSFAKSITIFLLSFMAGWGSELGIVILVVHTLFIIYALKVRKVHIRLPLWYFAGVVGLCAGWLLLYFSPGSAKRAALYRQLGFGYYSLRDLWDMSLAQKFTHIKNTFGRLSSKWVFIINVCWILWVVLWAKARVNIAISKKIFLTFFLIVLGVGIAWILRKNGLLLLSLSTLFCFVASFSANESYQKRLFFILGSLFALYMLYISATIQVGLPGRAQLHYTLIKVAICVVIICAIWHYRPLLARGLSSIIILLCVGYGIYVGAACIDMSFKWQKMVGYIEGQKDLGAKDIVVDSDTFKSFYRGYGDWVNPGKNPLEWPNNVYAKYFGIETFRIK